MKIESTEINKASELYYMGSFEETRNVSENPVIISKAAGNFTDDKTKTDDTDKSTEKNDTTPLVSEKNADIKSEKAVRVLDRILQFEVKDVENSDGNVEKKMIIKVLNESTGEVIRTIPAEEFKDEMNQVNELVGIMLDKKG